jgi:hypothetical protein
VTDNPSEKTVSSGINPVSETPLDDWHARFLDPTISDTILDRTIHNAYLYWVILKENCGQTVTCRALDVKYS